jgi:hypothetical protein
MPCSLCSRWFSRKLLYRHDCPNSTGNVKPTVAASKKLLKGTEGRSPGMAMVLGRVCKNQDFIFKTQPGGFHWVFWVFIKFSYIFLPVLVFLNYRYFKADELKSKSINNNKSIEVPVKNLETYMVEFNVDRLILAPRY